ncbi:MAG TPA: hypothetical protein PKA06_14600, partial [Gemmatales bacterium]|nr:hypothetical protein [Gemmatales bacterium]
KSSGALFKTIDATLPLQVNPPDFAWNEFEERLNRKGALVLDISVRNHAKAWTRLMETAGFPIAMDEQLQPVLAGKSTSTTMLYVDTTTVEQAKAWLERLKLADYWNVPEYRTDGV